MNHDSNFNDIIKKLKDVSNPDAVEGMARFGITPENTFGVSIPNLRNIAKETKKNHALAQQLWKSGFRETMILASMVDEPEMVTDEQMEKWVLDFDYWEICDQCCMNLFEKTGFAYEKAIECILFKLNGKLDNRFLRNLLQYLLFSSENKAIIIIPIEI